MAVLALKLGAAQVQIFRPYPDEVPWDLLVGDAADRPEYGASAQMRVAKLDDEVIAVYVLEASEPLVYYLATLVVAPGYRRRGLGRWLLGHAIGLAESKGGRELRVRGGQGERFLLAHHFEHLGDELRFVFIPE